MTEQEIVGVGPAFARYLGRYRDVFRQDRTAAHFDTYCRGLLSDLPRKSIEPIALASGTTVRTLQLFVTTSVWSYDEARTRLHRFVADTLADLPTDPVGTVGVIDETSSRKWGDHTPGVQRQYLGCVGKVDNGIVTVHVGVTKGTFRTLLDADLFLPESWDVDRARCQAAGIPDTVRHHPKWRLALDQLLRANTNGITFDWLTFDEGYGAAVPLLTVLGVMGQRFVGEIPTHFAVRDAAGGPSRRADERLTGGHAERGRVYRLTRQTTRPSVWRVATAIVWVADRKHTLMVARNDATGEIKYFLTNATAEPVARILAVAFRRWTVEHLFRVAKQEVGLMHYEGRDYTGLMRHLTLAVVVLGFVAAHTERLRGEKPRRDDGAGVPGAQRPVRDPVPAATGNRGHPTYQRRNSIPPAAKQASHPIS
ncbi:IS701 family transposase [Fimbriiglobus ruber]|uniref:Transposase IS701-like DDE domain-containing protein n=1 Tax=Fimbriiglobus ruber TaxID=1908690 RepID=A0A225DAY4_9BACT|nr:IS701 family transposase [Fimbriiglobus ruber]OWK38721.1 hypothetical protein FRUB_07841 [Fimbriiglobus ruber]OWK44257.1 hypothetical protein FRUB_02189 [Fimbriiglobus ruber]